MEQGSVQRSGRRTPPARELATAWLHLAVLWAFAVTQPLFNVLGDAPEFFVARDNTRWDILALAFGLTLIPPTVLVIVELILSPLRGARRVAHLAFVAVLTAAIALQVLAELFGGLGWQALIPLAAAAGAGAAILYARRRPVRQTLTVLSPAPALFLAVFLLLSPVSELVLPQGSVSAGDVRLRSETPVVMLVLDEFNGASLLDRNFRIDASRYPNFAKLAGGSTWYPNTITVADDTPRAVPAILSGSRPGPDDLPTAQDHPHNLFTLLGSRYAFHVQEPVTALCPESLCGETTREPSGNRLQSLWDDLSVVSAHLLLPDDLERDLPSVDASFQGFRDQGDEPRSARAAPGLAASVNNRPAQFERFLRGIDADGRKRTLHFLHILLPHVPYEYLPTGQQYFVNKWVLEGLFLENWVPDPFRPEQGHQRYLLQLGYVDRMLGRLVARLERAGLYDRALLVVTADHGVSFRAPGSRRVVSRDNFADIANVPLFVKLPDQKRGRIDNSSVQTADILPTIAQALGVRLPWKVDGQSRLRSTRRHASATVLDRNGEDVSLGFAAFNRMRRAEVLRRLRLFGGGEAGFFAFGPYSGLIGKTTQRVNLAPPSHAQVRLEESRFLADADPAGPTVPAFVSGEITGGVGLEQPLAVAVNGSIAAVVSTWPNGGAVRFSAMLPATSFRRGRNSVRLYAIQGSGDSLALSQVSDEGGASAGRLVGSGSDLSIELPGRSAPRVIPGAVTGFVEGVKATDPFHLGVIGWAADPKRRRRVSRVLMFADGRLVATIRPTERRPDVARTLGPPARRAGWKLSAEYPEPERVARAPSAHLRFFGVIGGTASELKYLRPDAAN